MNVLRHSDRLAFKPFGRTTSACLPVSVSAKLRVFVCAAYLDCPLHRRYASYKGKLALTNAEILQLGDNFHFMLWQPSFLAG